MDNSWGPFYKLQSILADYNWSRCDFPDPSCLRDFVFCALPAALSSTCFLLMSTKLLQIDELSNPQFSFPCACTVSSIPLVAYVWSICFEDFQEQNENEGTKTCERSWFLGRKNPRIVVSFSVVWSTVSYTGVCKSFHLQQEGFGACNDVSTSCRTIWQEWEWKMH